MKFHDIVCEAEGWAHLVNGVRRAIFPSWFMALNAARKSARRDVSNGIRAAIRHQTADGALRPLGL